MAWPSGRRRSGERRLVQGVMDGHLVWLLGAPRTGSTWLAHLLGSHPLVTFENEPLVGAHLGTRTSATIPEVWQLGEDENLWSKERGRADYVFSDDTSQLWKPALAQLLRSRFLVRHADLVGRGGHVVLKEPHGSEAARLIFDVLPGSRLLHLVRDPRDVLDSVLDIVQHGWQGGGGPGRLSEIERRSALEVAARMLRVRIDEVDAAWKTRPEELRARVTYENLRGRTEDVIRDLLEWLGLSDPGHRLAEAVREHSYEELPDELKGPGRFHRQARPGGWRDGLAEVEKRWATDLFGDYLERHGYPPE